MAPCRGGANWGGNSANHFDACTQFIPPLHSGNKPAFKILIMAKCSKSPKSLSII